MICHRITSYKSYHIFYQISDLMVVITNKLLRKVKLTLIGSWSVEVRVHVGVA